MHRSSRRLIGALSVAVIVAFRLVSPAYAQTAREIAGAAPIEPLLNEAPAKLVVDPPLPESLKIGRVVIQYRTENLHAVPVFGAAAVEISPRIGHLHVSVDGLPWVWMVASGEAITLNGLPPGPHKVRLQLENANHQQLDEGTVAFVVPMAPPRPLAVPKPMDSEPPAKIVVDPPMPEPLSRGVVFVRYRVGNVQIAPVFGPPALDVSPRVGHVHVTVDDAAWHWEDASGEPVIVNGLAPGPHKILIQLVNANHEPIDQATILVTVPGGR